MNEKAYSDTKFQILKMCEKIKPQFYGNANKINKFIKTTLSEIIQIGILITLLKSQNMKNILIKLSYIFFAKQEISEAYTNVPAKTHVYYFISISFCL